MTREKIQEAINTYENGNKSDFYAIVDKMSKLDIVNLISMMQPYHRAIARLQNHFESKQLLMLLISPQRHDIGENEKV